MKRHYLSILSIGLLFLILLSSCGGGGAGSSSSSPGGPSSMVTLTVGGSGQAASLKIEKKTLFAQAAGWFNGLIKTDEVIAGIPSNVSKITFTVSAPDFNTLTRTDPVSGQSIITETFTVPNGDNRHFAIYAYDSTGTAVYTGSTDADLNGSAVTLNISMVAATAATYTISGTVTDTTGKGVSGATVTLTGATDSPSAAVSSKAVPGRRSLILASMRSSTATTDSSGQYTFAGLASGTYTISVSLSGYSFSPSSSTVTVSNSNITGQNFVGTSTPSTHVISGTVSTVTTATGVLSGVTMTLSGSSSATATTDANGNYSFTGLQNGNYTITPSLTGYTFAPTNISVNVNSADVTGQNFAASSIGCNNIGSINITSISPAQGTVLTANQNYTFNATVQYNFQTDNPSSIGISVVNGNDNTLDNVTLQGISVATSSGAANVSAGATMAYQGKPVTSATVTVDLVPQGFSCTNVSDSVTYIVKPATTTYTISGTITSNGSGLQGVTVMLTGAGNSGATTDVNGNYSFSNVANGSYTVTPSLTGSSFNPVSASVTVNNSNVTQNFTASGTPHFISGSITSNGSGLKGVTITLTGAGSSSTTTDANGNYSFANAANGSYTITPLLTGYSFTPASVSVTVNNSNVTQNFTASAISAAGTISGTIIFGSSGLQGVTVVLTTTGSSTTTTDANGNYSFANVANGVNYTIVPSLTGYSFSPGYSIGTVNSSSIVQNFTVYRSSTWPVGSNPTNVAIDSSGNVWVANYGGNSVTEISNANDSVTTFKVGTNPHGIVIDSSGNVWVTNQGDNTVAKLSSAGTLLGTFPVGSGPRGIKIDSSGNAWVSNGGSNTVTKLSPAGILLGTFQVGSGPWGLSIDSSGNVWTANYGSPSALGNTVTKLSPAGTLLGTFTVGSGPHSVRIDPSGNAWVSIAGSDTAPGNTVTELSSSGAVIGTFTVGSEPHGIAIDSSGIVWVANYGSATSPGSTVSQLSSSGSLLSTLIAGLNPAGIAIDPSGNIWVANYGSNTVTQLKLIASPTTPF